MRLRARTTGRSSSSCGTGGSPSCSSTSARRAAKHELAGDATDAAGRIQQSLTLADCSSARAARLLRRRSAARSRFALRALEARAARRHGARAPGRRGRRAAGSRDASTLTLPRVRPADVSIVIPVHSGAELTRRCLESIRDHTTGVSYEVILVDDAADAPAKALLAQVHGRTDRRQRAQPRLSAQRQPRRRAHARGGGSCCATTTSRSTTGWLAAMLRCGESSPDVGVVTPKYLYPDGSLNEAGGDRLARRHRRATTAAATSPADCRYEFRREVDYGSAAALMVRADFWREVGGFDERYLPDVLRGHRPLLRRPASAACACCTSHAPTSCTSRAAPPAPTSRTGHKRHQELNRPKFVEKWRRPAGTRAAAGRARRTCAGRQTAIAGRTC